MHGVRVSYLYRLSKVIIIMNIPGLFQYLSLNLRLTNR